MFVQRPDLVNEVGKAGLVEALLKVAARAKRDYPLQVRSFTLPVHNGFDSFTTVHNGFEAKLFQLLGTP